MTTAETARRLLVDAAGKALCNSCLAFACSSSLDEMRQVTEEFLRDVSFQRLAACANCGRTVAAIAYAPKCAHCSDPVFAGDDGLVADGDILHAVCLRKLASDERIRLSRKLNHESRRLIEDARRHIRRSRTPPDGTTRRD